MIFYLIPGTDEQPSRLEPKQDLARAECKARGIRFKAEEMKHDVPTEKDGLQAYVNDLLERVAAKCSPPASSAPASVLEPKAEPSGLERHTPYGRGDIANDGHPEARPGFTSAQVHASALPRSEKVQDVCYVVSKMNAGELGFVALEVIARGARLGGLSS
jgi:hypothetical protein